MHTIRYALNLGPTYVLSVSVILLCNFSQVFVHGDELENYFKEFDADILPSDFDGKDSVADYQAIATQLFGSEDTAL